MQIDPLTGKSQDDPFTRVAKREKAKNSLVRLMKQHGISISDPGTRQMWAFLKSMQKVKRLPEEE